MNLEEVLNYRRSVRVYDPEKAMDSERVKHCVQMATLAPNSSNMQLWKFYHVCSPELLQQLTHASLGQSAVGTASELVIFVTRQDLHRRRAKAVLGILEAVTGKGEERAVPDSFRDDKEPVPSVRDEGSEESDAD